MRSPFHHPELCAGCVPTGPTAERVTRPCREESLSKQVKNKAIKDQAEMGVGENSYFHEGNKWWENKFIWSKFCVSR